MTLVARLVAAAALLAALAACNTVAGVGRDLQTGGAAISDSAQDLQSRL